VSVINGTTHKKIVEDIEVGIAPSDMASISYYNSTLGDSETHVYVVNTGSGSVSVISAEKNTKIGEDIAVGDAPTAMAVDENTDTVYVVDRASNGVSVIDPATREVVAGVIFSVKPFDSGYIRCDGLTAPSTTEQYIYVSSGTQCTAIPNEGFEFTSWEENLGGNSTQLIRISRPAPLLDSIANFMDPDPIAERWDSLLESWGMQPISQFLGLNPYDSKISTLEVTKFGTFTANFKELPPAFPPEYLIPLYGIIISTIVGWSIPSIISWAKSKRDVGKLNYYHNRIDSLYGDGKLDENDIAALEELRSSIVGAYSEGKLNEKHYKNLRNEMSVLYEKIFRKRIDDAVNSSKDSSKKKIVGEQLAQIRNDVKSAYSEGKINEKHYDLLSKDILELNGKDRDNTT
jgi:YVTN family beta-propeller protein